MSIRTDVLFNATMQLFGDAVL